MLKIANGSYRMFLNAVKGGGCQYIHYFAIRLIIEEGSEKKRKQTKNSDFSSLFTPENRCCKKTPRSLSGGITLPFRSDHTLFKSYHTPFRVKTH